MRCSLRNLHTRQSLRASDLDSLPTATHLYRHIEGMGAIKNHYSNQKKHKTMKNYQTTSNNRTKVMNTEMYDYPFFNLTPKSQVKPTGVQSRILRRIIEKRLAQTAHRKNKVIVPNELEPLFWQNDLEDAQNNHNFASQYKN